MAPLSAEQLLAFVTELRTQHNFKVSTQQCIAAQDLILALVAQQQWPRDSQHLSRWLAPILCTTPHEQRAFPALLTEWLERQTSPPSPPPPPPPTPLPLPTVSRRRWLFVWLALAGIAVISGWLFYPRPKPPSQFSRTVVNEQGQPLARAEIKFTGRTAFSNDQGVFTIAEDLLSAPAQLVISRTGYLTRTFDYIPGNAAAIPAPISLPLDPNYQPPLPGKTDQQLPSPTPTATPAPQRSWPLRLNAHWPEAVAIGLPWLAGLLWWWWRGRRAAALERRLSEQVLPLDRLNVKRAGRQLFQGQVLRRAAQALRRRQPASTQELKLDATVNASVRRAGLYTPVYGARQLLPEYLILIDRASAVDQQARFKEELAQRLAADHVFIETYYFQRDPRLCHARQANQPPLTLPELAARHAEHTLLILGDGHGLINPLDGRPPGWLELFAPWPRRALLTPETPRAWDAREYVLRGCNFLIQPATPQGLAALAETWQGSGVRPPVEDGWPGAYPEILRGGARRWVEDHAPPARELNRLCAELRAYLGEAGYTWLCACAVYPELNWNLTLFLGERFAGPPPWDAQLLALTRLPWFRFGRMPDWLRVQLLAALPGERETAVREAVEELLGTALTARRNAPDALEFGADRALNWRQRLARLFKRPRPAASLRDGVFLTFLLGRRPRLAVALPGLLARLLYRQGKRGLGLRPLSVGVLALSITAVGLAGIALVRRLSVEATINTEPSPIIVPTPPPLPTTPTTPATPIPTPTVKRSPTPTASPVFQPDLSCETDLGRFEQAAYIVRSVEVRDLVRGRTLSIPLELEAGSRFSQAALNDARAEIHNYFVKTVGNRQSAVRTSACVTRVDQQLRGVDVVFFVNASTAATPTPNASTAATPTPVAKKKISPGASISGVNTTAGSAGVAVVDSNGQRYLLGAVFALGEQKDIGGVVIQPGAFDGGKAPADRIGIFTTALPLANGVPFAALCSLVKLDDNIEYDPVIPGLGPIRGTREPALGLEVVLYGRTTKLAKGKITQIDVTMKLPMGKTFGEIQFKNAIGTERISQGGDSGAPVLDEQGYVVGIHLAGTANPSGKEGTSYFAPINEALALLGQALGTKLTLITQ